MDFKQVFLYDGTPYLAFRGSDGEYDYPNDKWTETQPPEGLYEPIHFNGNEWEGTSKEEWEKQQIETGPPKKDDETHKDQIIADLSLELLKTQEELKDVRKDISDLTIQLLGGNANA